MLPIDFLSKADDVYIKKDFIREGNYITSKRVEGKIVDLRKIKNFNLLENKIILLENADPDMILFFSKKNKRFDYLFWWRKFSYVNKVLRA